MAIIVDIDGTLLNGSKPIKRTIAYIKSLGEQVIIITGRHQRDAASTRAALKVAGVSFSSIYFRPDSDYKGNSSKYKKGVAQKLLTSGTSVTLAIDNDASARSAYASVGIATKNPASLPQIVIPKKMIKTEIR